MKLTVMIAFFSLPLCMSRPDGAPLSTCDSMLPGHEATSPQTTPSPFSLSVKKSGDSSFILTLSGQGQVAFAGFLLQARNVAGQLIGSFADLDPDQVKHLACSEVNPRAAVTHVNDAQKREVRVIWNSSPEDEPGQTPSFVATVAENFEIYWTDITASPEISMVSNSAQESSSLVKSIQDFVSGLFT